MTPEMMSRQEMYRAMGDAYKENALIYLRLAKAVELIREMLEAMEEAVRFNDVGLGVNSDYLRDFIAKSTAYLKEHGHE